MELLLSLRGGMVLMSLRWLGMIIDLLLLMVEVIHVHLMLKLLLLLLLVLLNSQWL